MPPARAGASRCGTPKTGHWGRMGFGSDPACRPVRPPARDSIAGTAETRRPEAGGGRSPQHLPMAKSTSHEHGAEFFDLSVHAPRSTSHAGPYGRMFPNLPPWRPKPQEIEKLADHSFARQQIPENPEIPAGYTYLGQFVAHDLTFDPTSIHQRRQDPERLRNFRTPFLDLDSVYGGGPLHSPYLFDHKRTGENKGYFFLIGKRRRDGTEYDLPRNHQGRALIPDPRNDIHVLVSQLHLAFLRFHNRVMKELDSQGITGAEAFNEARRRTIWYYQWIVIHDFLRRLVGTNQALQPQRLLERLTPGARSGPLGLFRWKVRPYLPLEFTVAVFRMGHAMVRPRYDLNHITKGLPVFGESGPDLRGHRPLPKHFTVCWDRFVKFGDHPYQRSSAIDVRLAPSLERIPDDNGDASLARRDLKRSELHNLPSGEDVSRAMGIDPFSGSTSQPLWYFVLREADNKENGMALGPVGASILAEVLIGLLQGDPGSFVRVQPEWVPAYSGKGKTFGLADFLQFARMPMTRRHLVEKWDWPAEDDDD